MSEPAEPILSPTTSAVRNTWGRGNKQVIKNSDRPVSDAALREYCDKYYHQLLPNIAKKSPPKKKHSESTTPNVRGEHRRGRWSGRSRSMSGSPERTSVFFRLRRDRSEPPRHRPVGNEGKDGGVFNRLGGKEKSVFAYSESRYQSSRSRKIELIPKKRYNEGTSSRRTEPLSESEDSGGGH
nr:hypothetical protein [Tanacetum cinerariifolium]